MQNIFTFVLLLDKYIINYYRSLYFTLYAQCFISVPYDLRGCHYHGKVYHKDQTWDEGCDFRCTCIDDETGRYTCQDM